MNGSPIIAAFQRAAAARAARVQTPVTVHRAVPETTRAASDGVNGNCNTLAPSAIAESRERPTEAQSCASTLSANRKRRLQNVLTDTQRFSIAQWMIKDAADNGEKGVKARAVRHFPTHFRGEYNANISRAIRYWRDRHNICNRHEKNSRHNNLVVSSSTRGCVKQVRVKARKGRGRKRSAWVRVLYEELHAEFERLRGAGVRFDAPLLRQLAVDIITKSTNPLCNNSTTDERSGINIKLHIRPIWVTRFMATKNIVSRTQTGKLLMSPAKREVINRKISYHLGQLRRDFLAGHINECDIFNADETHVVIHLKSNKTLAVRGDTAVKYADVVSGDEGMTLLVTLRGGPNAGLEPSFIIFKNVSRSYPIRGVDDNVPGITYRSSPKAWMDACLFREWLDEPRIFKPLSSGRTRLLYVDNCSAHKVSPEVLQALARSRTKLRFFPECATDLVQPADSFVIQAIKAEWKKRWNAEVMHRIEMKMWADAREGSGRLVNPGKAFFLRLAAAVVRDVSERRDKDGVLLVRKAMIRCGMALNLNGLWEEQQLSPELQEIIAKYRDNFNGAPVTTDHDLEGEATDTDNDQYSKG